MEPHKGLHSGKLQLYLQILYKGGRDWQWQILGYYDTTIGTVKCYIVRAIEMRGITRCKLKILFQIYGTGPGYFATASATTRKVL